MQQRLKVSKTFPICTLDDENKNLIERYPSAIKMPDIDLISIACSWLVTSMGRKILFTPGVRQARSPIASQIIEANNIVPFKIIEHPAWKELIKMKELQHPSKYTFLCNFWTYMNLLQESNKILEQPLAPHNQLKLLVE